MKQRTTNAVTGTLGVNAVRSFCDSHGFIFQAEPREDYGIDCYLEVARSTEALNFIISVQVKSGSSYFHGEDEHRFYVPVSENDVTYWLASNVPVVFACYSPDRNELYLKHVQAYAADKAVSPLDIKRIEFDKTHDCAGPQLAAYLKNLVVATPSESDRLEVAATHAPIFVAPNRRTILDSARLTQGHNLAPLRLSEVLKIKDGEVSLDLFGGGNSRVLGFSADNSWVLILIAQHLGAKCLHQELRLVNRQIWQELSLPLWTEADYDEGNEHPIPDELNRRISIAQRYVDELGITSRIELYREYRHLEDENQAALALEFGRICFNLDIERSNGRRALMLRTSTFSPKREAAVLIERLSPGKLMPWAESEEPGFFIQPKGFRSICEVSVNDQGTLIAFGILTNAEHDCWGSNDVHHIVLTIDELRGICIGAMRS